MFMKTLEFYNYYSLESVYAGTELGDEIKTILSIGTVIDLGVEDGWYKYQWQVPSEMYELCKAMLSVLVNTDCLA